MAAPPPVRDDDIIGTRAGGSALAEHERRKAIEEEEVRARFGRFPRIAELIVKVTEETPDTAAWGKGGRGEAALGARLGEIPGTRVLHDRLRPRSTKYNIDHIVVAPSGVYVIDAKAYSGKIECLNKGNFFRPVFQLRVDGRSKDQLVDSALKQALDVKELLSTSHPAVPIFPVLCFIGTEWGLGEGPYEIRKVFVTWPKKLYKRLESGGPVTAEEVTAVHNTLARGLKPAVRT